MSTRHAQRRAMLLLALALTLFVTVLPAQGATTFRVGYASGLYNAREGSACVTSIRIWAQELGKSGVTQLKAQFKRRGYYVDRWGFPFPSYQVDGYYYSMSFPNDNRSFYHYFGNRMSYPTGGRYGYWIRAVGVKPGLWARDVKSTWRAADIGCEVGPDF